MSTPPAPTGRPCPHCGQEISREALLCPKCGHAVSTEETWPPPPVGYRQPLGAVVRPIFKGILISNAAAAVLMLINFGLLKLTQSPSATLIASDFLLIPFVMGMVCAACWRGLGMRTGQYFLYSLVNSLLGLVISFFFMGEGVICLLIVSPLLIVLVFAGSLTGRLLFPPGDDRLSLSLIPLVLVLMAADALSPHDYRGSVSDTVLVHARPAQVWKHLAVVTPIPDAPDFWLFRMGLPYPIESTAQGSFVGAERRCLFTHGATFDERIVRSRPDRELTFDVVRQPADPEILGHAAVLRGQFLLHDNGDGTTTLTGTSWYRLYVYPAWYYDRWARAIASHVHTRVMGHIKALAEAEP